MNKLSVKCFVKNKCVVCNLDECPEFTIVDNLPAMKTAMRFAIAQIGGTLPQKAFILTKMVSDALNEKFPNITNGDLLIGLMGIILSIGNEGKRVMENSMNEEMNEYEDYKM